MNAAWDALSVVLPVLILAGVFYLAWETIVADREGDDFP